MHAISRYTLHLRYLDAVPPSSPIDEWSLLTARQNYLGVVDHHE